MVLKCASQFRWMWTWRNERHYHYYYHRTQNSWNVPYSNLVRLFNIDQSFPHQSFALRPCKLLERGDRTLIIYKMKLCVTHGFCVFGGISFWSLYLKNGLMKTTIISRLHTIRNVKWKANQPKRNVLFLLHFYFILLYFTNYFNNIFYELQLQVWMLTAATFIISPTPYQAYIQWHAFDRKSVFPFYFLLSIYRVHFELQNQEKNGILFNIEHMTTILARVLIEHWKRRLNTIVTITYIVE